MPADPDRLAADLPAEDPAARPEDVGQDAPRGATAPLAGPVTVSSRQLLATRPARAMG